MHPLAMPPTKLIELPEGTDPPEPSFNPLVWTLRVDGLVRSKKALKYGEMLFLRNEIRIDNYRQFGWEPGDVKWEGFPVRYVLSLTQPTNMARFVVFYSEGIKRAMSIADVLEYNPILAFKINGNVLDPKLGGPLRLVYDDGNAHYGIKWISRVELVEKEPEGCI
jgi:DMSO/TMAO reductase YedYZ molybdopterin-dependent catalytic subunit